VSLWADCLDWLMLVGTMLDVSLSPIGDTAAVAAFLWTVWSEYKKKVFTVSVGGSVGNGPIGEGAHLVLLSW
jgi:hypothetical protein